MNQKPSAINIIWLVMIVGATVVAAYTDKMNEITLASFDAAKSAVTLAIGLIGAMALWLGIMKIAEEAGLMKLIARAIRPLMVKLFPDVPPEHPAMSAMIMNMAANALGLGNAATPMGIKAMQELDKLNPNKNQATNAMCLFLAINTSSVTLLPLGVISVRSSAGATNPAAIFIPTLIATFCSTAVAIIMSKLLASKEEKNLISNEVEKIESTDKKQVEIGRIGKTVIITLMAAFFGAVGFHLFKTDFSVITTDKFFTTLSHWLIPIIMCFFLIYGFFKGIKVYETLTEGAKDGFNVAIKIIPYMVAIFVAIGMLRASGAIELLVSFLNPITQLIGMPAESLTVALLRPLSGSGSFAAMSEIINRDPNSYLSYLVSTIQGSTETTFYVLAVYFGAIGITKTRHALPAALMADAAGILASVFVCRMMF